MASSPRSGALGFWSELPCDGRWLLSTVVVQLFASGEPAMLWRTISGAESRPR